MLVSIIVVSLSWGWLNCDRFGGQQLHPSWDFIPNFHESLAWPPAGEHVLLPVVLLKSHPAPSPGIRAVGWNRSQKVEWKKNNHCSLLPQRPCEAGGDPVLQPCNSQRLRRLPEFSWGARKVLCLIPVRLDCWVCLCCSQDCVPLQPCWCRWLCPIPLSRAVTQLVTQCGSPGREMLSPSCTPATAAKQQSFCFYQQFWMGSFCRVPV